MKPANLFQDLQIVRLLVREKSGAWYVDQGYMFRAFADQRKKEWNSSGFGVLILKHSLPTVRIVPAPRRTF